jgi:hypothetical protein
MPPPTPPQVSEVLRLLGEAGERAEESSGGGEHLPLVRRLLLAQVVRKALELVDDTGEWAGCRLAGLVVGPEGAQRAAWLARAPLPAEAPCAHRLAPAFDPHLEGYEGGAQYIAHKLAAIARYSGGGAAAAAPLPAPINLVDTPQVLAPACMHDLPAGQVADCCQQGRLLADSVFYYTRGLPAWIAQSVCCWRRPCPGRALPSLAAVPASVEIAASTPPPPLGADRPARLPSARPRPAVQGGRAAAAAGGAWGWCLGLAARARSCPCRLLLPQPRLLV